MLKNANCNHMIKQFIQKINSRWTLLRPIIVTVVPSGVTQVERRAIEESVKQAGARKVYVVMEPVAAGIGADLPITKPACNMVVDDSSPNARR